VGSAAPAVASQSKQQQQQARADRIMLVYRRAGVDRESAKEGFIGGTRIVYPKTDGDCPDFAEPAEQNGTVPLSEQFSDRL
jgi:hypothetical protein